MIKPFTVVAFGIVAAISIVRSPTDAPMAVQATRDAATTGVNGELQTAPGVALLVGTQGSVSAGAFRARTLIACDKYVSKDIPGMGGWGLATAYGNGVVHVCSYSISNGNVAQDVQFVYGTEVSSGSGTFCNPGLPVSAKFHLVPNQFVSQGSGVGSLFTGAPREGLCLKVFGNGPVGVNVSYASF